MSGRLIVSTHNVASAHNGNAVSWPSVSLKVRCPAWPPLRLDQASGCPLAIDGTKRYRHVRWSGLRLGAWSHVECDLENRSTDTVHSYALRFVARERRFSSGYGSRPEGGVPPGGRHSQSSQIPPSGCIAIRVDFVQFGSGDVWHSTDEDALVTEAGVRAGAHAAAVHLLNVLERSGVASVMASLPRLHADVFHGVTAPEHGFFGFYSGVTNLNVRVQHAYDSHGPGSVDRLLRSVKG